jgi:ketosteroid isomerase-like protein
MSQENVKLVRDAITLLNRGDFRGAIADIADDFEMDWSNSIGPLSGVYRGRKEVTEFWESFLEAWDELNWDMHEVIDLGGEDVLVVNNVRMRGRASGIDVQAVGAQVWTIRNGKLVRAKVFQGKAEALEAVGLSEQDAHADS